jgi:glycosyltransferase involved in cell wall biosynthesis
MITALLPVKNVAGILRETLEHLRWVPEILLIDGNSTDGTLSIAADFPNVRVLQHPSRDIRICTADTEPAATHEWILWVQADEIYTPELAAEILKKTDEAPPQVEAFKIQARDMQFGADFGFGNQELRLWRKEKAKFPFKGIHDMPKVSGEVQVLQNFYWHKNNPVFHAIMQKAIKYNDIDATNASDEECARVNQNFWYQLARLNFFSIRAFLYRRRFGFPATCWALGVGIYHLTRHIMLAQELRIRHGETKRDSHGW